MGENPYHKSHVRRRALTERQKAQLAELVSEGYTASAAARVMGITQQRASQLWLAIKADLGED